MHFLHCLLRLPEGMIIAAGVPMPGKWDTFSILVLFTLQLSGHLPVPANL
jgi:hypothetical protein